MTARFTLTGEVALVTGATSGIGWETALALARAGAVVVGCGRRTERGAALLEALAEVTGDASRARFIPVDVTREDEVRSAVEEVTRTYGRLDLAFNNAGTMGRGKVPLVETREEDWEELVSVNFKGCWNSLRFELAAMRDQGHGAIVNCSSVTGLVAFPGLPLYTAAKHAIVGLTKAAALEHAGQGIRVNAVCPSAVETELLRALPDDVLAAAVQAHPIPRMGTLREVADLVTYLLSDSAGFITGQAYALDGGYSAG
ncbi:SDR family oxidoreductase [Streptomyces sp. NPDC054796]